LTQGCFSRRPRRGIQAKFVLNAVSDLSSGERAHLVLAELVLFCGPWPA